ncbi:MAG: cell surface protein SprA, partial [Saprospiraceae bacterium]
MKIEHFLLCILVVFGIVTSTLANFGGGPGPDDPYTINHVIGTDTIPLQDRYGDFLNDPNANPFDLNDPGIIEQNVEYDPTTGNYIITETIDGDYFRPPTYMTFEEYFQYQSDQQERAYFDELAGYSEASSTDSGLKDPISDIDVSKNLVDRLFGGSTVDIKPQGQIGLTFGLDFQKVENPSLTLRQQRQGGFDFDMDIRLNVTGKIGEKLNLATNYNTQATFDFDNQLKLAYDSEAFSDDDIVKNIEAGNVSFPLKGSLIQGSQSLFGIKTELQFGHLGLTLLASQQKSRRQELQIQGGSQFQEFEVRADEYDENRHFFLTHYNRQTFEKSLVNMPQVNTLFKVNRIEVWVTNERNDPNNVRDIVALADIGESIEITNEDPRFQLPASPRYRDIEGLALPGRPISEGGALNVPDANDLYGAVLNNNRTRNLDDAVSILQNVFGQKQSRDFEKVSARQLSSNEYSFNPELGFISVNVNLQADQILGVAFEYDYNGKTYKVGEFANDSYSPDSLGVIFVKMLKSTTQRIDLPTWDLMMKNVYSVGAFQVNKEDFKLDIFYEDPGKGEKRFLPDSELAGVPLLQIFNLDNLNVLGDPCPDGIFDFVPGITINPRNGRIMFPVLEPFSTSIADNIQSSVLKEKYDYFVLYDSTVIRAREYQELNRFTIRGNYKSSVSSEISLGSFNLPPGSVTVRAGGQTLIEGSDYEVDYNIGRIKILNDSYLNSGLPINVSFEDNTLFGFQTKTLLGVRADYEVNDNFNIGATYLHLFERPFTQKVNIGDDPINNRIYGMDVNYSTDAPWLTRAVDAIPFINTKAESSIAFTGEFAWLKPGHSKAINQGRDEDGNIDKSGVVYVDDFEGSTSSFDLRTPANNWVLSSVPQNDDQNNNPLFPESDLIDTTLSGSNRALLNWYRIDQSIRGGDNSNPYTAAIPQTEVFPTITVQPGLSNIIQTLDMTYYPDERGPYNFDIPGGTPYTAGLSNTGKLFEPETRWAGIMRSLNTNDFQAANIEYLEFWLLDPYLTDQGSGDLYINMGNVSEDILRDSRKFFENGLPTDTRESRVDTTGWGLIPRSPQITNSFVNDVNERKQQDVGLDGLNNDNERSKFSSYLNALGSLTPTARADIQADPSNDDYIYFRDAIYDDNATIFDRYRRFNMPEGNTGQPADGRPTSSTNLPDTEDINRDNTLSETESYYQYKISLNDENGDGLDTDNNPFITEKIDGAGGRRWYRFKIPLDQYTSKVGSIQDFRSIRFVRMYMHGFEKEVTLRFARLELVRNQWRRYQRELVPYKGPGGAGNEPEDNEDPTIFDVNAVSIEENSQRQPFQYVLPPGIDREQSTNSTFPDILQNEQSLSIEVCNLQPNDVKAIYKNIILDMRLYKRLRMFVHAEASDPLGGDMPNLDAIQDGELSVMMRIGSDFENNYYEYEIPLVMSRDNSFGPTTLEYKEEVWKPFNNFDIAIEQFKNVKTLRNASGDPEAFNNAFEIDDEVVIDGQVRSAKLRVKGNPNLGNIKGIMVGVINRSNQPHCAELWINELRMSGFDERGGFAAIAKVDMQLADFG